MSEHQDNFGAFLAGLLLGGLAGGISALLFAPQSGEETRTIIRDKAIELRDQANETMEETMSKAEKVANDTAKQAEGAFNQAKSKVNDMAKKSQVILEEQKDKLAGKKPKEDKA